MFDDDDVDPLLATLWGRFEEREREKRLEDVIAASKRKLSDVFDSRSMSVDSHRFRWK